MDGIDPSYFEIGEPFKLNPPSPESEAALAAIAAWNAKHSGCIKIMPAKVQEISIVSIPSLPADFAAYDTILRDSIVKSFGIPCTLIENPLEILHEQFEAALLFTDAARDADRRREAAEKDGRNSLAVSAVAEIQR